MKATTQSREKLRPCECSILCLPYYSKETETDIGFECIPECSKRHCQEYQAKDRTLEAGKYGSGNQCFLKVAT